VSNDQSPPVRKVIPYKKGGRRQSPFSGKAFQFSGTALDIAIQQREQEESEEQSPEITEDEEVSNDSLQETPFGQEVKPPQELSPTVSEPPPVAPIINQELVTPAAQPPPKSETVERKQPQRSNVLPSGNKQKAPAQTTVSSDLLAFITRWKPFLTQTQIGICSYIYNNSTAVDREFCFTSNAKLMAEVSKTERQVKTVLNQLLEWNFLIKGETIINAPRERRGTFYKLNLNKS
jgi:type IV secretory pathway VirB10-like protein